MSLKEELEFLRGEPIGVFNGDPKEIPCIETSDAEKLCKHPVVSVHMITYNHEQSIGRAIEGVMMQQTDFEYELVLGEDCSTDRTRDICLAYQLKYPDKIRVLWWHENLRKVNHPAGENYRRTLAHCRGEYIAYCEGDDWWTDPQKLQKQVEVMRKHPNVMLCFCGSEDHDLDTGQVHRWNEDRAWEPGVVKGGEFIREILLGKSRDGVFLPSSKFIRTATVLLCHDALDRHMRGCDIARWKMVLADLTTWVGVVSFGDAYFLPDCVGVYNLSSNGACRSSNGAVDRDAELVAMYYVKSLALNLTAKESLKLYNGYGAFYLYRWWARSGLSERRNYVAQNAKTNFGKLAYGGWSLWPALWLYKNGVTNSSLKRLAFRWWKLVRGW